MDISIRHCTYSPNTAVMLKSAVNLGVTQNHENSPETSCLNSFPTKCHVYCTVLSTYILSLATCLFECTLYLYHNSTRAGLAEVTQSISWISYCSAFFIVAGIDSI